MTILKSQEWSQAHLDVNESLSQLLSNVRDYGYNPSLHVHYDETEHRLILDPELRAKHPPLADGYERYRQACDSRDAALLKIQELPKLDIGF